MRSLNFTAISNKILLLQVSPPDEHGYCSLGTSVDCVRAALQHSKFIVGEAPFILLGFLSGYFFFIYFFY